MTIDDDNSVYVGGFPYNATDDTLRRAFDTYGRILSVKIINDHLPRGKCYAFITFTNHHSAVDAIHHMNGQTIGGRVVRVNEVTTRAGRLNSDRVNIDEDRARNRLTYNHDHYRDHYDDPGYTDRTRERSRSPDHHYSRSSHHHHSRSRDRYGNDKMAYDEEYQHDHDLHNDPGRGRDHVSHRNPKVNVNDYSKGSSSNREWEREHHHFDHDEDKEMDLTGTTQRVDQEKDHHSRKLISSEINDGQSKEQSSNSRDDHTDLGKTQLERSVHMREEVKKEQPSQVFQMEDSLKDIQQLVLDLQRDSEKLEDALLDEKKRSSRQQTMLTKLCKSFLQVKEDREKLKSSEKELQALVEIVMIECDMAGVVGTIKDAKLSNGNA
ncbi:hypothetical protein ACFE04_018052 [Oxalis oulophora]